ncbi:unnamed protein product [Caenorhabditis sp. 36 PRJEB53466]|nr:unnamed protein product [Caenorhabditis sp. 36 PRJEB53466]
MSNCVNCCKKSRSATVKVMTRAQVPARIRADKLTVTIAVLFSFLLTMVLLGAQTIAVSTQTNTYKDLEFVTLGAEAVAEIVQFAWFIYAIGKRELKKMHVATYKVTCIGRLFLFSIRFIAHTVLFVTVEPPANLRFNIVVNTAFFVVIGALLAFQLYRIVKALNRLLDLIAKYTTPTLHKTRP